MLLEESIAKTKSADSLQPESSTFYQVKFKIN